MVLSMERLCLGKTFKLICRIHKINHFHLLIFFGGWFYVKFCMTTRTIYYLPPGKSRLGYNKLRYISPKTCLLWIHGKTCNYTIIMRTYQRVKRKCYVSSRLSLGHWYMNSKLTQKKKSRLYWNHEATVT